MAEKVVKKVLLAGPIKWWWGKNWRTYARLRYFKWRKRVSKALVKRGGYLVYHPHMAMKGDWSEDAQIINDAALSIAHIVLVLTPPGVLSEGTDGEVMLASANGAKIIYAPPGPRFKWRRTLKALLDELDALPVGSTAVLQEEVIESMEYRKGREILLRTLTAQYAARVLRFHYVDASGDFTVTDTKQIFWQGPNQFWLLGMDGVKTDQMGWANLKKIEVLARYT